MFVDEWSSSHQCCFVLSGTSPFKSFPDCSLFCTTQAKREEVCIPICFQVLPSPGEGSFSGVTRSPPESHGLDLWFLTIEHMLSPQVTQSAVPQTLFTQLPLQSSPGKAEVDGCWALGINHSTPQYGCSRQDWHSSSLLWGPVSLVPAFSLNNLVLIWLCMV